MVFNEAKQILHFIYLFIYNHIFINNLAERISTFTPFINIIYTFHCILISLQRLKLLLW